MVETPPTHSNLPDKDSLPDEEMLHEEDSSEIPVSDHLDPDALDQCGYCGQHFGPDEIVIEKTLLGRMWRFCSEDCLRDFRDASDFRDEDLDGDISDPTANISADDFNEEE